MKLSHIKHCLVNRGPDSLAVQVALKLYGLRHGFQVKFRGDNICVRRGTEEMVLHKSQFVQVPIMIECYSLFFETMEGKVFGGRQVLDFSQPGQHKYKKSGASFWFPSIPEDYVMDAYTYWYNPNPGDIVWDAGAYAGATSYFLAELVGPTGKVYAFEPDDLNFEYLERNIALHSLRNVTPIRAALDRQSGTAQFSMDGTMAAGIENYLSYRTAETVKTVPTLSIQDACSKLGGIPAYIKMDIEGAEVAAIEGARDFLRSYPINFAIESYHIVEGQRSFKRLENIFKEIGYEVISSNRFGQMFTWAKAGETLIASSKSD